MKNKTMILNECVQFINKFEILEYHIFIEYITKNSIYFYEFDFMDCQMIKLF